MYPLQPNCGAHPRRAAQKNVHQPTWGGSITPPRSALSFALDPVPNCGPAPSWEEGRGSGGADSGKGSTGYKGVKF